MPAESRAKSNGNAVTGAPVLWCAIYTRKSTDEGLDQAFNSLDAQRESAEAFINSQRREGWVLLPQRYDDGGYTGANMDRPALQRLLADLDSGVANCVVVYKVDRLTRSLLDFARIMETLDRRGATFVSVTQQFNTTNSLGRLTLNILLSFAQFERDMISERTRDKMSAARRKGKWVGGNLVLGYDVAPQGGALIINEAEAPRVREIFRLYLEYESLIPVVQELDRRGWRMKAWTTREGRSVGGSVFTKNKLHCLLTNPVYAGRVGYRGQIYAGEHPRIIDDETWNRVQDTLHRNGRRGGRNIRNKYSALLKGLVRCATCDAAMVHTYVQKKKALYRYYVCVKAHQRGWNTCLTRSVSAPALEGSVVEQIRGIARSPEMVGEIMRQLAEQQEAATADLERQRTDIQSLLEETDTEIGRLAPKVNAPGSFSLSGVDRLAVLQQQAANLERRHADIRRQIRNLEEERVDTTDLEQALNQFGPLWERLSPWNQEQFVHTLIEQVRYNGSDGTVTIGFRRAGIKRLCQNAS